MANITKTQKALYAAEAAIEVKTNEALSELNDIASILPALKEAVQDAADEVGPVSEVWGRIRKGEEVSPADLVHAEAQEKINEKRLGYLNKRESALKRFLPVDTRILSERTAGVVGLVMQGFEVYVTHAPVGSWEFPENTTAIVVVANGPVERDAQTGLVSGSVTVLFNRPGLYRPISVAALEAAAKAERLALTVQSNRVGDECDWSDGTAKVDDPSAYVTDTLTVRLTNVIDGHAVIPQVDLSGLHSRTWVEEVFRSNGSHPSGVPATDKPYLYAVEIGRHTVATGWDPEIASQDVDDNGVRTLVVRQKINTFSADPSDFHEGLSEAIALEHGYTHRGMGVLVDSEVKMSGTVDEHKSAANWIVTYTFESKVA